MKRYRLAAMAVAGMAWSVAPAGAGDAPKWGAHVDLEGKLGTDRHLGEVDLFLPVAQNGRTLLFADLRTRMDDEGSREGNFGLGVRTMLESGWNLGTYGYFDRRRSEYHNYFNQVTVGAEALSLDWDLRGNVYAPIGRTAREVDSLNTAELSGSSVIFRGGEERALGGFDAEIGWRVPLFEAEAGQQLRVYAGGYRFADDGVPTVAGPRGRAEMVFDEVPYLWEGSRLSLGAEWQRDEPRGSQGFLTARLRIPLQAEASPSRLTPMERRMADPIVRDVDIVAQAGTFGAAETVSQLANGRAFSTINSASTADLPGEVAGRPNDSAILLSGTFNTTATVDLAGNKSLVAGSVAVRSPSGRTAILNSPATISSSDAVQNTIQAPGNNTISGLTIIGRDTGGGARAIEMNNTAGNINILNNTIIMTQTGLNGITGIGGGLNNNVTIRGNVITVVGVANRTATGLGLSATMTNVTVSDNWVSVSGGGTNYALDFVGATGTVSGNTLSASGGTTNHAARVNNATLGAGSTGNVVHAGIPFGAPAGGFLGFADGTTYP